MPDRRKIKVLSVVMAEDVRYEINGTQSIVGAFAGRIAVGLLPFTLQKLAFRIEFESEDNFVAELSLSLTTPSNTTIAAHLTSANITKDNRNVLVIGWTSAKFSEAGVYKILFGLKGHEREEGKFEILASKQQPTKVEEVKPLAS